MAIVEVQFRDQSFFELVKAQVVRTPLPSDFRAGLGPLLIERFECHDVALTDDSALQQAAAHVKPGEPAPNVGQTAPGELLLRASISLHLTTYANAKAAGSLAEPKILAEAKASLFIRLGVSPADGLTFRVLGALVNVAGLVENEWRVINMAPGTQALTSPGDQLTFARAGLVGQSGVIAIRLGTRTDDDVLAVDPATLNRLAGNQWGQFIAGQCFAELVAQSLNDAAELAVAGPPTRRSRSRNAATAPGCFRTAARLRAPISTPSTPSPPISTCRFASRQRRR